MLTGLPAMIAELTAARAALVPLIEGLHDLERVNLQSSAQQAVTALDAVYTRRLAVLDGALAALQALEADDYPAVERPTVPAVVFDDLAENVSTITAAFGQFVEEPQATTLQLAIGEPEPK